MLSALFLMLMVFIYLLMISSYGVNVQKTVVDQIQTSECLPTTNLHFVSFCHTNMKVSCYGNGNETVCSEIYIIITIMMMIVLYPQRKPIIVIMINGQAFVH